MITKTYTTFDDPLDDLFGPATLAQPRELPKELPIIHLPEAKKYWDRCGRCSGSGRYGRFGRCYSCKGKGGFERKTSPEAREKARESAANRKARIEQEGLDIFAKDHPDVWGWMNGSTFPFAVSLMESLRKYGSLTEKQLLAAYRCVEKLEAAKKERETRIANAPTVAISVEAMEMAFRKATATGLKRPSLRIGSYRFSLAGPNSKNAGAIYVKNGNSGVYMGKIADGKFYPSRECDDEAREAIIKIGNDPKSAALEHGRLTGHCTCCGRFLTDPVSVAAGIGPICARSFGW